MNRLYILLAALLANIAMLSLASCSDDDNGGGQPVIECVRTTDPELADSTFTDATVGQMILIQGTNLSNAIHVYINDQDVYFNSNYNTDTHIIVTIPSDLVVRGMDESVPLEIRVETSHGTATYAFHVVAGVPSLDMYKAQLTINSDGVAEMLPGQEVILVGSTLHEIEHIYVADMDTVPLYEITEFQVNADRTEIKLKMPANAIPEKGIYLVECYAGNAYCGFSRSPQRPILTSISTDMPIPGQRVEIYGKYLSDITELNLCGELKIDVNKVETNENMDKLVFTMPDFMPSDNSNGLILVATLGGRESLQFYDYTRTYEDFDGHSNLLDYGWGATNFGGNPAWDWPAIPSTCPITVASGNYVYLGGTVGWWNHVIALHHVNAPAGVDPSTPLSQIEFRYEMYVHETPVTENPTLKLRLYNIEKADIPMTDHVTGQLMPGQWVTVSVPMSDIAPDFTTFADVIAYDKSQSSNNDNNSFMLSLGFGGTGEELHIAYDNFRFYVKKQQ